MKKVFGKTVLFASLLVAVASFAAAVDDAAFTKPDYVVYVPSQPKNRANLDPAKTGDSYNDHFQVLWDAKRKLYCAFWTQASWEGAGDHHIVFSKSADRGQTWSAPVTLAGSECRARKRFDASWQQPMLSKSARLYCLWNQTMRGKKWPNNVLAGFYSDDGGETWSAPDVATRPGAEAGPWKMPLSAGWINWQRPLRLGKDGKYFVGCSESGGTTRFWRFENIDDNPEIDKIAISDFPKGMKSLRVDTMAEKPVYTQKDGKTSIEEASVVKLPDGRLFALMRSTTGHPVWSQSRDGGETWEAPKILRDRDGGKPFLHPRSPCPIYDWKGCEAGSGYYFSFVHDTFDFNNRETAYQVRGPLYLIAGRFDPQAEQPIAFLKPKFFAGRGNGAWNSFYTSYTVVDGEGVLWYPDMKYYLLGRKIGPEWFAGLK